LKGQLSRDLGYTATAFYKDYFDYIVSRSVEVRDPRTGVVSTKAFSINQDYARVRGFELGVNYRFTRALRTSLNGSFQVATGKSNTAAESRLQIRNTGQVDLTKEQYLAWDRPFDLKHTIIFAPDSSIRLFGMSLKGWRFYMLNTWKSGLRYTPTEATGIPEPALGRVRYELIDEQPYQRIGSNWYWTDIKISRDFFFGRGQSLSLSVEIQNLFNNKNAQIINPVTGTAYEDGDPLLYTTRDPYYPSPTSSGLPPYNPARYLQPRHILFGIGFNF
jgi:outer membrane receptor protein involved in Fe transport